MESLAVARCVVVAGCRAAVSGALAVGGAGSEELGFHGAAIVEPLAPRDATAVFTPLARCGILPSAKALGIPFNAREPGRSAA